MKELIANFKKLTFINKAIFFTVVLIFLYFIGNLIIDFTVTTRINNEISNLKFRVNITYFEHGYSLRTIFDKAVLIELKEPITKEQFDKMTFEIPGEEVSPELINEKKIKVNLKSEFTTNKETYLLVKFYSREIYKFNYVSSSVDKDYFKDRKPDKSPMEE